MTGVESRALTALHVAYKRYLADMSDAHEYTQACRVEHPRGGCYHDVYREHLLAMRRRHACEHIAWIITGEWPQ